MAFFFPPDIPLRFQDTTQGPPLFSHQVSLDSPWLWRFLELVFDGLGSFEEYCQGLCCTSFNLGLRDQRMKTSQSYHSIINDLQNIFKNTWSRYYLSAGFSAVKLHPCLFSTLEGNQQMQPPCNGWGGKIYTFFDGSSYAHQSFVEFFCIWNMSLLHHLFIHKITYQYEFMNNYFVVWITSIILSNLLLTSSSSSIFGLWEFSQVGS